MMNDEEKTGREEARKSGRAEKAEEKKRRRVFNTCFFPASSLPRFRASRFFACFAGNLFAVFALLRVPRRDLRGYFHRKPNKSPLLPPHKASGQVISLLAF
jgi:hypothetical protein